MQTVETLALSFPAITRVPTFVFDAVTSWGFSGLNQRILSQFRKPTGWLGRFVGLIMTLEHTPVTNWALDLLQIQPGDRVLDAGCGSGNAIRMMLQRNAGFVAGIDYSAAMVDQSRIRNAAAVDSGRCQIRQSDIAALPFPDASFDKVTTIETLYFWPDTLAGLTEIRRVLAPGGRIAVVLEYTRDGNDAEQMDILERDSGLRIYSNGQVADMLREAGFDSIRMEYRADRKWLYVEGTVIAE